MSRLSLDDLRQFTGDLERFVHPLNRRVLYTPGVRYLAETGGAYWLIDAIAAWLGSPKLTAEMQADERLQSLQFWKLDVHSDQSATLICQADTGEPEVIRQQIPWTDFPLPNVQIWVGFDGRHWVLYLPSKH